MSFPKYEKYKESGVEWLGEVPEHWEILNGRRVFRNRSEIALREDVQLAASQKYGIIPQSLMMELNNSKVMLALKGTESFRHVEKNDFVISLRSFEGGIEYSNYAGCVSPAYTVLALIKDNDPNFYRYSLKSKGFIAALQSTTDSLRDGKSITYQQFCDIPLVIPTQKEQQDIALFLDRETAKIDELVEEQQRLIELLKEKRQAVISHTVTRGLNPNVKLKPSGIEWVGDVPVHWEVKKLRYLCNIQTGARDTEHAVEDGEFPFFVRSQTIEQINSKSFDCEAVLTAGDGAGVGKVFHYYEGPFDFHQRVYMMNNFKNILGCFFFHYFREHFYRVALEGGAKSTVDSLRRPMLTNFPVCLPPKDEQEEIIRVVEKSTASFDILTAEAQRAIDLLQERRTALISAAVTGKIDVRQLNKN